MSAPAKNPVPVPAASLKAETIKELAVQKRQREEEAMDPAPRAQIRRVTATGDTPVGMVRHRRILLHSLSLLCLPYPRQRCKSGSAVWGDASNLHTV